MKRLLGAACLVLAGLGGMRGTSHGVAVAAASGNSAAAQSCQQGGYLILLGSDGTTFTNVGQCVSYAAHGGTFVSCAVTLTTGCLTLNNATFSSNSGTGHTITFTGTTSFVDTCASVSVCIPSLPNSLAAGGGTYVKQSSSGAVISAGTYRVANTQNTLEGLLALLYRDGSGTPTSTCSAATGYRQVQIIATLIDSTTHVQQQAIITITSGTFYGPTIGFIFLPDDGLVNSVPDSTITC